jgi:hypothetical protein
VLELSLSHPVLHPALDGWEEEARKRDILAVVFSVRRRVERVAARDAGVQLGGGEVVVITDTSKQVVVAALGPSNVVQHGADLR